MRYGFCTGFATDPLFTIDSSLEAAVSSWGFDFIEYPLMAVAALPEEDFEELLGRKTGCGLECDSACNLFPGNVPVIGEKRSEKVIRSYLDTAFSRASRMGVKKLIFGSAGARRLGDYDRKAADREFLSCLGILNEYASEYGMSVLIEAIRRGEADYINTLAEAAAVVRTARERDFCQIGLMADLFHMYSNGEDAGVLETEQELLGHVHVCESERMLPERDFSVYMQNAFALLKKNGYDYTISYESVHPKDREEGRFVCGLLRESFEASCSA